MLDALLWWLKYRKKDVDDIDFSVLEPPEDNIDTASNDTQEPTSPFAGMRTVGTTQARAEAAFQSLSNEQRRLMMDAARVRVRPSVEARGSQNILADRFAGIITMEQTTRDISSQRVHANDLESIRNNDRANRHRYDNIWRMSYYDFIRDLVEAAVRDSTRWSILDNGQLFRSHSRLTGPMAMSSDNVRRETIDNMIRMQMGEVIAAIVNNTAESSNRPIGGRAVFGRYPTTQDLRDLEFRFVEGRDFKIDEVPERGDPNIPPSHITLTITTEVSWTW